MLRQSGIDSINVCLLNHITIEKCLVRGLCFSFLEMVWLHQSEPQTRAGPLPFVMFFTSISNINNSSFIKLESFLIPFLITRGHDESVHTFGSSHWFLEVPQKGVLKKWVLVFFEQNVSSTFCHQTSSTCHTDTTQWIMEWSTPWPD